MSDDINYDVAVGAAVDAATDAFESADKHPLNHGFAHLEGIDGRTALASALEAHPDVRTEHWSHVTVDGVSRYLNPQMSAYRAFIETLDNYGVDTDGIRPSGRLD
jgi:hypothetical protein